MCVIAGLASITSITILSSSTNVADTDDSGSDLRILYIVIAVVGSIVFAISAVLLFRCVCKRKSNLGTFESEIEIVNPVQSAIRNTTVEVDMSSQCRLPSHKADRTTPTVRHKARAYSAS